MIDSGSSRNERVHARNERGFSLAEVLIAVAMLAVIILALFGLVSAGVRRAYGGKKMTQAADFAQAVMERVNVYAPHEVLGVAATATTATKSWSRSGSTVTPGGESGTSDEVVERNAWRTMLATADLPATSAAPATLTVTATPLPSGQTFASATMVRIEVNVGWSEYGTRQRQVRLQTLNLREEP
jgi:prepilin-type N-terminal cleavage/methylation domain-containing protein